MLYRFFSSLNLRILAWRQRSLVVSTTLKILLVGLSVAALFGLISLQLIHTHESSRLMNQVDGLLTTVESTVKIACYVRDTALAEEVARGLMTNPSIAGVRITSGALLLAETKKAGRSNIDARNAVHKQVTSPFNSDEVVGEIVLIADSDYIRAQATSYSLLSTIVLLLEVIAVTFAVAVVILRTVVIPIRVFSDRTHDVRIYTGQHVAPPTGNEKNEIGKLAEDFNVMIDQMSRLLEAAHAMQENTALSERRYRTLVENSPDIIARYDKECRRIFANPAYARETGTPIEDVLHKSTDDVSLWHPTLPHEEYTARLCKVMETGIPDQILLEWARPDGLFVSHEMYVVAEHDAEGNVTGTLAIGRDVTQRKAVERQLMHQASYDTLTQLPNRRMFHYRLHEEIARADRNGEKIALLFIDLDRFKEVNDTLGHETGDLLLIEAAQRIRHCVRESDMVARLGGDEFVVVIPDIDDITHLGRLAQTIIDSLLLPFQLEHHMAYVSASIGIASYPMDADHPDLLISCADQAMYAAKDKGRNGFSFFTSSMQEQVQARLSLSNDLREALAKHQLQVWMQPIVDVPTGKIVKAEALLRWLHPVRGMVPPDIFIPLAEEIGIIQEIGDWVFREAAATAKRWLEMRILNGCETIACQVSVNVSPRQFIRDDMVDSWIELMKSAHLPAQCMVIEITEGLLLSDQADIIEKLGKVRAAGIQVALDDFGTGYSAMAYLKKFNIDYLKIDRSFIRDLETDPNDRAIAEAIIVMAHKLGLKTIAEGVETLQQRDMLASVGCEYVQGYLYAKPMPADEFETLLSQKIDAAAEISTG